MVAKPRLLSTVSVAATLLIASGAPALGAFGASSPDPLRREPVLRLQDVAAIGARGNVGPVMAVGWRRGKAPGELFLAFSTDGGGTFLKNNGKLRKYRVAGDGRLGLSLAVCGGKVWASSSAYFPGDTAGNTDVLITNRVIGGGAGQAFMTSPSADRRVRDVAIACVGNKLLAIAWLEESGGKTKAKLMLRDQSLGSGAFRKVYGMGQARFKGGIAVAATGKGVHVAWTKGSRQNLRYKRFLVGNGSPPSITRTSTVTVAFDKVQRPQLAAIGQKVGLAYTDRGKVKVKVSDDLGATFGNTQKIVGTGTPRKPSRAHSIDLSGQRIVVEATKRQKNGASTPQRIQSNDLGANWSTSGFGHKGSRMGALQKVDNDSSLLKEAWHHNGSPRDTLRAQIETS